MNCDGGWVVVPLVVLLACRDRDGRLAIKAIALVDQPAKIIQGDGVCHGDVVRYLAWHCIVLLSAPAMPFLASLSGACYGGAVGSHGSCAWLTAESSGTYDLWLSTGARLLTGARTAGKSCKETAKNQCNCYVFHEPVAGIEPASI